MKICLLANDYVQQFPLKGYGGVEICVESLAWALWSYNHEFFVITPQTEGEQQKYPFPVYETKAKPTSISKDSSYNYAWSAREIIKVQKPDVIWSQSHWSADALNDLGIPIICTFHDSCEKKFGWIKNYPNVRYRFLSEFSYNNWVTETWERKISFVTHSGLIADDYELNEKPNDYLLWVGGLVWGGQAKGLDYVMKLAELMPEQEFRVYGAGNPQLEGLLQSYSQQYRNFHYMGELERGEEHHKAFANAKAFLMPTRIPDTFPRVVLEAMSKGTPVIGSNCGSVPETIGDTGMIIDPDNPQPLNLPEFDRRAVFERARLYHILMEVDSLVAESEGLC